MKDRFKIVVGIATQVEDRLNKWAEQTDGKLKRTQLAAIPVGTSGAQPEVVVLCTWEPAE